MALPLGEWGVGEPRGDQTLTRDVADRAPLRESAPRADSGNPTRIVSLENCGPTVERCPRGAPCVGLLWGVESARLELASSGCRPDVLPLNYDPAGREGIDSNCTEAKPQYSESHGPAQPERAKRVVHPLSEFWRLGWSP